MFLVLNNRTLTLDVLHNLWSKGAFVGETHLGGESGGRHPSGRSAGVGLLQHAVNLFQGEALGLRNQEIGVDETAGAERAPDEEDLCAEIALVHANHVRSNDGNDLGQPVSEETTMKGARMMTYAVPEPVGGSREGDTAGADWKRKNLSDDNPRTWTPSGSEEEDVDADECDHGADGFGVSPINRADNGNDELADDHSQSTPDKKGATTESLNGPEGDWGGADIDEGGDEADEEGITDGSELLEESRSEVEDEVDTRPLLHHLQGSAEDGSTQVAAGLHQSALEAIGPAAEIAALRDHSHFVFVVGHNLRQLLFNELGSAWLTAKTSQNIGGAVEVPLLDKVPG